MKNLCIDRLVERTGETLKPNLGSQNSILNKIDNYCEILNYRKRGHGFFTY
jgi:hypothetical protein